MTGEYRADEHLGRNWPDLATFRQLAGDRRVIPVVRRLLADGETPIGLYRKLADGRPGTFLLESAEHDGTWSRYSIVGARARAILTDRDGQAQWLGEPPVGVPTSGDVAHVLEQTLAVLHTPRLPGLPPLTGGMVGMLGYDIVRHWEHVPDHAVDELGLPRVSMMLADDLAVYDHVDSTVLLIANAINQDGTADRVDWAWQDAVHRLDAMADRLSQAAPATVIAYDRGANPTPTHRSTRHEHADRIEAAKQAIRDGEAFQVVVSQRFDHPCLVPALEVYRCLRASNPSPYMYVFHCADADGNPFDVVGSSPEALVKVTSGRIVSHPIAGTRPRGATPVEDAALVDELLADPKERAEHLMLVDLARNDVARVAVPGSVEVTEFMAVERYSQVMHMVSTVTGVLAEGHSSYDVLRSTFPAGTLSGAPKPRAMELIDELEPTRRGLYGGTVGYLDFAGDLDMAIAIRTAVIRGDVAYVQAGGGIVADSDPDAEYAESQHKAAAVLRAIAAANTMVE